MVMSKTAAKTWQWALVILTPLIVLGSFWGIHAWMNESPHEMNLQEALWVCSADMKTYYPPGSPESMAVVQELSKKSDMKNFLGAFLIVFAGILLFHTPALGVV